MTIHHTTDLSTHQVFVIKDCSMCLDLDTIHGYFVHKTEYRNKDVTDEAETIFSALC